MNNLFKLLHFAPPADLTDPNNMTSILVTNMMWEEEIARQCALLDNDIFARLHNSAKASKCDNLAQSLLFDIVALGRYTRLRITRIITP